MLVAVALWVALAVLGGVALAVPPARASLGVTERVSVGSGGVEANARSYQAAVSADGRFVGFASGASNVVVGDTNDAWDVFVRDRESGVSERVSVGVNGAEPNADSVEPVVSADGRFVAFSSEASNLVAGDTNDKWDVFVHDRHTGHTERMSVGAGGEGDQHSSHPALSPDGRFVAFESQASNLVAGDTNGTTDAFLRDRQTDSTERVGVGVRGVQANDLVYDPQISADGRFVAFESGASNLVAGDTNAATDVFVRDRQTGVTERVSVGPDGAQTYRGGRDPTISADGRFVAFWAHHSLRLPADSNGPGVFVRDRQVGTTQRVTDRGGYAVISSDGRFVAFENDDFVVLVHDRQTGVIEPVSVGPNGTQANGNSRWVAISGDGRVVAFESDASNLVAGDTNDVLDVFARDRAALDTTPADTTPPTVRAPWFPFAAPFAPGPQQPVSNVVRWVASDASAVCGIELQHSVDDGPFTVAAQLPATSTATVREHAFGHRYRYRVRASDCAGNISPWKTSVTFVADAFDARPDTLPHLGAWSQVADADAFNGTLTSSLSSGDSVSYTITACRIAWIAPRDRDSGTAKVSVDGLEAATVNLITGDRYQPQRRPRRVIWQKAWPTTTAHTIRIEVLSGRVDIDAVAALRCTR